MPTNHSLKRLFVLLLIFNKFYSINNSKMRVNLEFPGLPDRSGESCNSKEHVIPVCFFMIAPSAANLSILKSWVQTKELLI